MGAARKKRAPAGWVVYLSARRSWSLASGTLGCSSLSKLPSTRSWKRSSCGAAACFRAGRSRGPGHFPTALRRTFPGNSGASWLACEHKMQVLRSATETRRTKWLTLTNNRKCRLTKEGTSYVVWCQRTSQRRAVIPNLCSGWPDAWRRTGCWLQVPWNPGCVSKALAATRMRPPP